MPASRSDYQTKYEKENIRRFNFKLSRIHDADLVSWIESQDNFQAYLKALIRQDMEAHGVSAPVPDPENT